MYWAVIIIVVSEILNILNMLFLIPSGPDSGYFKFFYISIVFSVTSLYFFVKYLLTQ